MKPLKAIARPNTEYDLEDRDSGFPGPYILHHFTLCPIKRVEVETVGRGRG